MTDIEQRLTDRLRLDQAEIERLRGFIARRYPGFDVDEAIALHDVKPNNS